ncbi:hypothetical protein V502_10571 [Pseudogymnoascus sp. VKM F-4520 (FW-2644)]|nr:hypothetical protein V502_10571 [Pseudogymnoascus sp. VKM F-4520 (FW-2644)]
MVLSYSDLEVVPGQLPDSRRSRLRNYPQPQVRGSSRLLAPDSSGLQYLPPDSSGLQLPGLSGLHDPDYTGLEAREFYSGIEPYLEKNAPSPPPPPNRVICGLAPRSFWIFLTVIIAIVVVGAVGGGVGGILAAKNSRDASSAESSPSPSALVQSADRVAPSSTGSPAATSSPGTLPSESKSTPSETSPSESKSTPSKTSASKGPATPSPTSTTPSLTTTQIRGPSATLLSDCPSSNNTLYSVDIGSVMSFRKLCGLSYPNDLGSTLVNVATNSLNDCINLCAAYNVQIRADIKAGKADVCNAVCWRNTFDNNEFPGQCFGYTSKKNQTGGDGFAVQQESICDSAAWVNQDFF